MNVDTLIDNLTAIVLSKSNTAISYTNQARLIAAGEWDGIAGASLSYATKPSFGQSKSSEIGQINEYLTGFGDQLEAFYCKFFPDISAEYMDWLGHIRAIMAGEREVPRLDNATGNELAQSFDARQGERNKEDLRIAWSGRGYRLPPGALFKDTRRDVEMRSESLAKGAMERADAATGEVVQTFSRVLAASLNTFDSKIAAVNAVSDLILAALRAYKDNAGVWINDYERKTLAIEKVLAYYEAERKVDQLNTDLYRKNSGYVVNKFVKNADMHFTIAEQQSRAASAASEQAANIARAAYSSLNSIVSASTVGF